ncbi:2-oxo acid dehydrogenase subunit E2 [Candidatus Woesearchaeota archaeon]|nr:2-oxo acid dehydrogenase subunit E2 [Candidatus Woesearchaeota archaeon]
MIFQFKLPDIGEGITEAEIVEWLVKEKENVKEDQPIIKIETDKAVVELPSPHKGKIVKLYCRKGDVIKVGSVIAGIEVKEKRKKTGAEKAGGVVGFLEEASSVVVVRAKKVNSVSKLSPKILALPSVRELSKEKNIDISSIKGSGLGGRITKEDILKAVEAKPIIKKKYDLYGHINRIALKGARKTIAKKMLESSKKAASVTHIDEIDVTDLAKLKEVEHKRGIKITYLPYIIKAVVLALKKYPVINSSLEGDEIIIKKYYNIGIAVDTKDGLIVPVLKGADKKDLYKIAKEIAELADKARNRTIDLADLKGSSFTITNIGSIGGLYSTPIINPPEAAILALGRIMEKPIVMNDKVIIRKILPASLTFDHQILDGAEAARFINKVKSLLQNTKEVFNKK